MFQARVIHSRSRGKKVFVVIGERMNVVRVWSMVWGEFLGGNGDWECTRWERGRKVIFMCAYCILGSLKVLGTEDVYGNSFASCNQPKEAGTEKQSKPISITPSKWQNPDSH